MAALRRALPGLERWERPTSAPCRFSSFQPGRLAQGPEENSGRAGRMAGLAGVVMDCLPSLQMSSAPWGGRGPGRLIQQIRRIASEKCAVRAANPYGQDERPLSARLRSASAAKAQDAFTLKGG